MYTFPTCTIEGQDTRVVYRHPQFSDYGLGVRISRGSTGNTVVHCDVVTGKIDGKSVLSTVSDHTAPLDVNLWCLTAMRTLRESVNTKSINLNTLFPNNGGVFVYPTKQEI